MTIAPLWYLMPVSSQMHWRLLSFAEVSVSDNTELGVHVEFATACCLHFRTIPSTHRIIPSTHKMMLHSAPEGAPASHTACTEWGWARVFMANTSVTCYTSGKRWLALWGNLLLSTMAWRISASCCKAKETSNNSELNTGTVHSLKMTQDRPFFVESVLGKTNKKTAIYTKWWNLLRLSLLKLLTSVVTSICKHGCFLSFLLPWKQHLSISTSTTAQSQSE